MQVINLGMDPTNQWDKLTLALFDEKYKHLYEVTSRNLDEVFTEWRGVRGQSLAIPTMGAIVMADRGDQGTILPTLRPDLGRVSFDLVTKSGKVPVDIVMESELKANLLIALATEVSASVKRMEDQFVLDALMDKEDIKKMSKTTAQFGVRAIIEAKLILDNLGVPANDRHIIVAAPLQDILLNEKKITNADYVNVKALVEGNIKEFAGFKFHWIPEMPEGGLKAVKGKVAFVFRKSDGAQAWGIQSRIERHYDPNILSNVMSMVLHGAAKVLVPQHVVAIAAA